MRCRAQLSSVLRQISNTAARCALVPGLLHNTYLRSCSVFVCRLFSSLSIASLFSLFFLFSFVSGVKYLRQKKKK